MPKSWMRSASSPPASALNFFRSRPIPRRFPSTPPSRRTCFDLKNVVKPETAAEDLFTALCKDVLGFQPTRQVGSREGWVDFMLPEPRGVPLPLELKPLFQRDGPAALWRGDANPKHHVAQVKKYLRDHEYLNSHQQYGTVPKGRRT